MMTRISTVEAYTRFKHRKPFIAAPSLCSPNSMLACSIEPDSIGRMLDNSQHEQNPIQEAWGKFRNAFWYYNCNEDTGDKVTYYKED